MCAILHHNTYPLVWVQVDLYLVMLWSIAVATSFQNQINIDPLLFKGWNIKLGFSGVHLGDQ